MIRLVRWLTDGIREIASLINVARTIRRERISDNAAEYLGYWLSEGGESWKNTGLLSWTPRPLMQYELRMDNAMLTVK